MVEDIMAMTQQQYQLLDEVVMHVRYFFVWKYPAGTREMIYRYVVEQMTVSDLDPRLIYAALVILKKRNAAMYYKQTWWFLGDR